MEQKRTLWIIAAVGIFLLVVLGAALIVSSSPRTTQTIAATAPVSRTQSDGWTQLPERSPSKPLSMSQDEQNNTHAPMQLEAQQQNESHGKPSQNAFPPAYGMQQSEAVTHVNDMTVIAQNATVYGIEKGYTNEQGTQTSSEISDGTLIDLNALKTVQKEVSVVTPKNEASAKKMEEAKKTVYAPPANALPVPQSTQKSTPQKAAATTAQKKAATTSATPANASAQTAKKTTTQYWVQAASFANKGGADSARTVLDDNKIPADVFTFKDSKGTVYYRVRIGPYMTKSEAEYWRTRVAQINEFKSTQSYVTQTASVVN